MHSASLNQISYLANETFKNNNLIIKENENLKKRYATLKNCLKQSIVGFYFFKCNFCFVIYIILSYLKSSYKVTVEEQSPAKINQLGASKLSVVGSNL